jgi:hypothetical protein
MVTCNHDDAGYTATGAAVRERATASMRVCGCAVRARGQPTERERESWASFSERKIAPMHGMGQPS